MAGFGIHAVALSVWFYMALGAFPPPYRLKHHVSALGNMKIPAAIEDGTFEQLLDHAHPELGTFKQRYWPLCEHYGGSGSPIVLYMPGETSADSTIARLANGSLADSIAQTLGAGVVILEHRYYGGSSPYASLTIEHLRYLTLRNAIADLAYFAQTVTLPFDPQGTSRAPTAPWILAGGSYAGALAAWTAVVEPGVFWASYASSAPVQAIWDFWQYFEPVQAGMPKNCSADVQLVIRHVDDVLARGRPEQTAALKARFGLGALAHDDDFEAALELPLWTWQERAFFRGYDHFASFCDSVEGVANGTVHRGVPDALGVGLEKALDGFAKWMKDQYLPGYCKTYWGYTNDTSDLYCLDTHNIDNPLFTDLSVNNGWNRQWMWLLCNEPFGWWQDGAPQGHPTLISRLVTPEYWERQCNLAFRPTAYSMPNPTNQSYGFPRFPTTVDAVNTFTGGWSAFPAPPAAPSAPRGPAGPPRIFFVNGELDPWRPAGVSSDERLGGPMVGTAQQPVHVIPGGVHCEDLSVQNVGANEGVAKVWQEAKTTLKQWVDEFYAAYAP